MLDNYDQCWKSFFFLRREKKDWSTVEVLSDKGKDSLNYHWLSYKVILKISHSSGFQ